MKVNIIREKDKEKVKSPLKANTYMMAIGRTIPITVMGHKFGPMEIRSQGSLLKEK